MDKDRQELKHGNLFSVQCLGNEGNSRSNNKVMTGEGGGRKGGQGECQMIVAERRPMLSKQLEPGIWDTDNGGN